MVNKKQIKKVFTEYFNNDVNFMTPYVFGFTFFKYDDENIVLIEKSSNNEGTLYGASSLLLNPKTNIVKRIELGECFSSLEELDNYVMNISNEMFEDALAYGEEKLIII